MSWVRSEAGFRDFLPLVIVHAPDDFPEEDYLEPHEQLTLDLAFAELRAGVDLLTGQFTPESARAPLRALIEKAYAAYSEGNELEGSRLLHELESQAFGDR